MKIEPNDLAFINNAITEQSDKISEKDKTDTVVKTAIDTVIISNKAKEAYAKEHMSYGDGGTVTIGGGGGGVIPP
ncbi:MAG: hypothetical protein HRT38_01565 [Alteromonadaceae bacterium]|nr:hypothetical protein [Alteromonadaceae bacterium]